MVMPEIGQLGQDAAVKLTAVGPLTSDQMPYPTAGALPAIVAVEEQTFWSGPALAAEGPGFTVTFTVTGVLPQELVTVQV